MSVLHREIEKEGRMLRIINRPKRYVHRNAFTEPYVDFEELKLFYEDKDWMVDRLGAAFLRSVYVSADASLCRSQLYTERDRL